MIWPVTLVGGLVGLAVAHIPGALLGVLVGSIIDRKLALNSWTELRERLPFLAKPVLSAEQTLFMLLGHLAKSTGRVAPEHIQAARFEMQRLQISGAAQKTAIAAFARGKNCRLTDLHRGLHEHYATTELLENLLMAGWRMCPGAEQRFAAVR